MKVDLEKIENFYDGRMSNSDRDAFEKLILSDAEVAMDVKSYILSRTAIEAASNGRLKQQLMDTGKNLKMPVKGKPVFTRYLALAASLALLTGLGWIMFLLFHPQKSAAEIYLSYYQQPDISEFTVRGAENDSGQLFWDRGLDYYANHKIKMAEAEFSKIIRMNNVSSSSKAYFMLALCYMEMNESQKAIQTFDHVSDKSNFVFMKQYYSALCLVRMEKKKEASDLLQKIVEDQNHPYRKYAIRILREL